MQAGHLKTHMSNFHGVGVVWFPCTAEDCEYKCKMVGHLNRHMFQVHGIPKKEDPPGVMRAKKMATMLKNRAEAAEAAVEAAEAMVAVWPPLPPLPQSFAVGPNGPERYGVPPALPAFTGGALIDANGEVVGETAGSGESQLAMLAYCVHNADKLGI